MALDHLEHPAGGSTGPVDAGQLGLLEMLEEIRLISLSLCLPSSPLIRFLLQELQATDQEHPATHAVGGESLTHYATKCLLGGPVAGQGSWGGCVGGV